MAKNILHNIANNLIYYCHFSSDMNNTVLLYIFPKYSWCRDTLPGISAYRRDKTDWNLKLIEGSPIEEHLESHNVIGCICVAQNIDDFQVIADRGIPLVNLSGFNPPKEMANILHDNQLIGQWAAKHLIGKGLDRFCCFYSKRVWHSVERCDGFCNYIVKSGLKKPLLLTIENCNFPQALEALQKPIGLFCVSDIYVKEITESIWDTDIKIPQDIALIGVDNDLLITELSEIPISCIEPDFFKMGWEASRLLHEMIHKHEQLYTTITIPPKEVISRQSTEYLKVDDDLIRKVKLYIVQNYTENALVCPSEIARKFKLSERSLHRRFKNATETSIHKEVQVLRMSNAKKLLIKTRLPIIDVAMDVGYENVVLFNRHFKTHFEMTPSHFRKVNRR